MPKIKHLPEIRKLAAKTPIFTARDIELLVKNKKYAHVLLHHLAQKGEINRILKGFYSLEDDPTLSVFCFRPAYIGLQEALSFHNLWEQETNTILITTQKVRTGFRKVFNTNVMVNRLAPQYFFGFDYLKYGNFYLPVSDIEKTLIDLVYFNQMPVKAIIKAMKRKIDPKKFNAYLQKYPKKFQQKVHQILS